MTKVRQDAWSHEDDLLLAETVLRHIREGSTQLEAFEEVGDRLNRTGAACGFRWNAIVRKKYEQAIEIAKKQRKLKKRAERKRTDSKPIPAPAYAAVEFANEPEPVANPSTESEPVASGGELVVYQENELNLDRVITYLQALRRSDVSNNRLEQENRLLQEENGRLRQQVEDLQREIKVLHSRQQTVEDDYQALIGIMERARRMVAFQDQDDQDGVTFKMDQNGNLEKIAK